MADFQCQLPLIFAVLPVFRMRGKIIAPELEMPTAFYNRLTVYDRYAKVLVTTKVA